MSGLVCGSIGPPLIRILLLYFWAPILEIQWEQVLLVGINTIISIFSARASKKKTFQERKRILCAHISSLLSTHFWHRLSQLSSSKCIPKEMKSEIDLMLCNFFLFRGELMIGFVWFHRVASLHDGLIMIAYVPKGQVFIHCCSYLYLTIFFFHIYNEWMCLISVTKSTFLRGRGSEEEGVRNVGKIGGRFSPPICYINI